MAAFFAVEVDVGPIALGYSYGITEVSTVFVLGLVGLDVG